MRGDGQRGHQAGLVAPQARHHDTQGCHYVSAAADGHGYRAGAQGHLLRGRRVAVGPDRLELGTEPCGLDDRVGRDPAQRGQDLVLRVLGGVGEEHLAHAGGVHGQPGSGPAHHGDRALTGQPVQVQDPEAVPDGEVDGGQGGGVQVLQERRGDLAQAGLHGCQQRYLPECAADGVVTGRGAGQHAERGQLAGQPVRRGQREAGPAGQLGQRQPGVGIVERGQQGHGPRHHRCAWLGGVTCHRPIPSAQRKSSVDAPGWDFYRGWHEQSRPRDRLGEPAGHQ